MFGYIMHQETAYRMRCNTEAEILFGSLKPQDLGNDGARPSRHLIRVNWISDNDAGDNRHPRTAEVHSFGSCGLGKKVKDGEPNTAGILRVASAADSRLEPE